MQIRFAAFGLENSNVQNKIIWKNMAAYGFFGIFKKKNLHFHKKHKIIIQVLE